MGPERGELCLTRSRSKSQPWEHCPSECAEMVFVLIELLDDLNDVEWDAIVLEDLPNICVISSCGEEGEGSSGFRDSDDFCGGVCGQLILCNEIM
jgi:hypothetical protein